MAVRWLHAWRRSLERLAVRVRRAVAQRLAPGLSRRLVQRLASGLHVGARPAMTAASLRSLAPIDADRNDDLGGNDLLYGDFADAEEAERFAALPPIEPIDLVEVDWEALARELTREA